MRHISIINQSTVVPAAEFKAGVAACALQATRDFGPIWDIQAEVVVSASDVKTERIYVLDNSDQAGALGYHDVDKTGVVPVGFVFAKTSKDYGEHWQATLSHELLEQLADPDAVWGATATFKSKPSLMALEVADPVEALEYLINNVPVSNFVTPEWFLNTVPAGTKFDFMGKLKKPLTMSPGGYILYSQDLKTWKSVFGKEVPKHVKKAHDLSRRARRFGR